MTQMFAKVPRFYGVLLVMLALLPWVQDPYYIDIVIMTFIWATVASAWNISGGYAGQFSLGHAGYLGIGAYTSTLLYLNFGISPWIGMIIGGVAAMLFAFLIGIVCFRLRGPFYTLATIAFAELIHISTIQLRDVTQGSMGLQLPYEPGFLHLIFEEPKTYAFLAFFLMVLVYGISSGIQRSRLGYFLVAMREDADAARSLGINVTFLKLASTGLSAFLTAICGTFLAQYILFIEPENILSLPLSIQIAMIAIVGGMGSAAGPIIGSILLTPLGILLRGYATDISGLHLFIYGLLLVVIVLYLPNGLVSGWEKVIKKSGWVKSRRGGNQNVSEQHIA